MILEHLQMFFSQPINVLVTILAIVLSSVFFFLSRKNEISANAKVAFLFIHLSLLVFPVFYFGLQTNCQVPILNCDVRTIATFIPIGLAGIFVIGFFAAPFMFTRSNRQLKRTRINKIVDDYARRFGIKSPKLYLLDTAKPVAYSFSNFGSAIFISAGMMDLFEKKELEAVLLHELGHIKEGSSLRKFSTMFTKVFSPLAAFTSFGKELSAEEHSADMFAADVQGTWRFVISAKSKVDQFNDLKA